MRVVKDISAASAKMAADRRQYEHITFPLLVDWRETTAAIKLRQGSAAAALDDLQTLEGEIRRPNVRHSKTGIAKPGSATTTPLQPPPLL
jgi:hypothetical protein